jgi:hypothetical protein
MSLRHKKQWSLMLLASVLLMVFLCIQVRANLSVREILLRFAPMKSSRYYIQIDKQGSALVLRLSGLFIYEELSGSLKSEISDQIFNKIERPDFQAALNIPNLLDSNVELMFEDTFCLYLASEVESVRTYCNSTRLAPKNISSVVEELLSVTKSLNRQPKSLAYLRCELIPSFRFETLKTAGKLSDFEKLPHSLSQSCSWQLISLKDLLA